MLRAMAQAYSIHPETLIGVAEKTMPFVDVSSLETKEIMWVLSTCITGAYGPAPDFVLPLVEQLESASVAPQRMGQLVRLLGSYIHKHDGS